MDRMGSKARREAAGAIPQQGVEGLPLFSEVTAPAIGVPEQTTWQVANKLALDVAANSNPWGAIARMDMLGKLVEQMPALKGSELVFGRTGQDDGLKLILKTNGISSDQESKVHALWNRISDQGIPLVIVNS